jgi:hypothetical protein
MDQQSGITRTAIVNEHALTCPTCAKAVFVASGTKSEVPGGGYWLSDGDTVGGVYQALTDRQRSAQDFSYELLVGTCRACDADFYVVEASFMPAHPSSEEYLHFNMPLEIEKNFVCSLNLPSKAEPLLWLQHEYLTAVGTMRHNVFGPYKLLDRARVVGEYGVSSCRGDGDDDASPWSFARNLLLATWDHLIAPDVEQCEVRA